MNKVSIPSIFDLNKDKDGVLRMPFNPMEYGDNNGFVRKCSICDKEFPQGQMKELSASDDCKGAYHDEKSVYRYAIFYCHECWFGNEISDASKWSA